MSRIKFGNVWEEVVTRDEFPLSKAKKLLQNETVAVIGYGVQGPAQALNLRDNGIDVIVGQRSPSPSFEKARKDGWKEGKNLFSITQAAKRGTIVAYLLSDAGQVAVWPKIKKHLTKGKAVYFSHGFAITYKDQTGIVPSGDIDVIMVAPKGSGRSVRKNFLSGSGINSSFAVFQDATGSALERTTAMGVAIGSGYLFKTTFKDEVYSDLVGERGALVGALTGLLEAQYEVLRRHGHSPSEAFNETVEELTESLIKLVSERGMDFLYANISTTAQRGALDWKERFKREIEPLFEKLYQKVADGTEAKRVLEKNSQPNYKNKLAKELLSMKNSEMWRTGSKVRSLRPRKKNR